jgi:sphingomyelin phosphodiesterase acid-like 3
MVPPRLTIVRRARIRAGKRRFLCLLTLFAALLPATAARPAAQRSQDRFLIASDIHFNPMADPTLVSSLQSADPGQWESILQHTNPDRFSPYGEDTNWWLLQSVLNQMRKTLPHPAFVMFTGDLLAHGFPDKYLTTTHDNDPEHYRAFVLKTVKFLAIEIGQRFPGTKILVTPGNNDDECSDYGVQAGGTFLSDTAIVARDLAQGDESFTADWKALGSYNVPHPTIPGVRILSLNTVFLSNEYHAASFRNGCALVASTAAGDLLRWLQSNLAAARQADQRVWLMFHIPPGIDGYATTHKFQVQSAAGGSPATSCADSIVPMWVPAWTAEFDRVVTSYADMVQAGFAGHTHMDDFRLVNTAGINQAFVLIDPAISPIFSQNPAFRIVIFRNDGSLANQSTYYLTNLRQASRKTRGRWKKEYTFTSEWRQPWLEVDTLGVIYGQIQAKKEARDRWLKLYEVSSPVAKVPADAVRGLYCAIGALGLLEYERCYCH